MTVFAKVIKGLGLHTGSQGTGNYQSWLYVLLSECDRYETLNPTADVFANPYAEVLRRLGRYSDTFAYQKMSEAFGTKVNG